MRGTPHPGLLTIACLTVSLANAQEPAKTLQVARLVRDKGVETIRLDHYTGVLLMQGMAELAVVSENATDLSIARETLLPYATGKAMMGGNFVSYRCGGNGAAILLRYGKLPEGRQAVLHAADATCDESPRSTDAIVQALANRSNDRVFIDTAFPVTPFLLWTALSLEDQELEALRKKYIAQAWLQTKGLHDVLWDPDAKLYHQGRGFQGEHVVSSDHWSRGNGWAALAWAAIIQDLPKDNPHRDEAVQIFRMFMESLVKHQDSDGMWRQEMTRFDESSYPETSGTGLLLYAMAVGIDAGVLDDSYRESLRRGLSGCLRYVEPDGSVLNTCIGTLCPGDGTPEAYCKRPWKKNDPHAFGPLVLAFAAAHRVEMKTVERPSDEPSSLRSR